MPGLIIFVNSLFEKKFDILFKMPIKLYNSKIRRKKMMLFGERIRQLRKEKKWSQDELAKMVDSDARQISRYERGKITPYADTIVKIANVFEVTTDYLLIENAPRKPFRMEDKELLNHIEDMENLTDADKKCLYYFIDALKAKNKIKSVAQELN
jgi:transcriptional regulator with XRE-family HTH domain